MVKPIISAVDAASRIKEGNSLMVGRFLKPRGNASNTVFE